MHLTCVWAVCPNWRAILKRHVGHRQGASEDSLLDEPPSLARLGFQEKAGLGTHRIGHLAPFGHSEAEAVELLVVDRPGGRSAIPGTPILVSVLQAVQGAGARCGSALAMEFAMVTIQWLFWSICIAMVLCRQLLRVTESLLIVSAPAGNTSALEVRFANPTLTVLFIGRAPLSAFLQDHRLPPLFVSAEPEHT